MQDSHTIPIEYVRLIGDQLRGVGVDIDTWLARGGLVQADLAQLDRVIDYVPFRKLVLSGLEASREPAMGLFVGERLVASTHGAVGAAAVNASTVREALDIVERFSRLRTSLITISHEVGRRDSRIIFTEAMPLGDVQRPILEAIVLSIKNVFDAITLGACQTFEVAFPFDAPEYAALVADIFGCKIRYRQNWAGFRTPPDVLDVPLKLSNAQAFEEAARICQRELELLTESETYATRVRRLLLEKQQGGFPNLAVSARHFHMTARTLHRRLESEGTSFREQLETVRHTLAIEHVKSGRFGMDEIAYRLGYTDLANFRRAFKRWENVAPSVFRERHEASARDPSDA